MYNRVILMGRLVRDPELRSTQNGVSMCRITVAVDRQYQRQGEERQADFLDVICWRNTAEFVCKYFGKGKMIHIEGKLQNNNYTDQNGNKVYRNDIIADAVAFCGDKSGISGGASGSTDPPRQSAPEKSKSQQPAQQPQQIELGDLGEFEEILSDGEVPF